LTKRVALGAVTTAAALLLLTAFSLQSVLYPQIIQQQSSYAQEPTSPITNGNASSSPPPGNSSSRPFVEPGSPLPVEPDRGPGGQPGEPGGPTTEPQQQPPPQQTVDSDNNLTQTDGILTATINGANFTRNQTISVQGKVDDADITPESGVWITVKDPMNETTHAIFVPANPSDKSFSYGIVAGYYDRNSRGFYKPMTVSGKNYTMTIVYNTDDGPSTTTTTTSSGNNKSSLEVQFVFAYNHSSTTSPPVSAAVTAENTGPASAASQFAGNQSTTGNQSMTTTNMTTTTPAEETEEEEVSEEDGEECDNSYPDECIPPPPPVLDCSDIDEDDFEVRGSDPHGFDDDNDGVGCETAPQAQ
jgi:hypothetical protein